LQRGYRLGDRVLRPSVVRVSCGPPPAPASEVSPADETGIDQGRANPSQRS
jgi:hypothetical protein